jgi:hypothetical protein
MIYAVSFKHTIPEGSIVFDVTSRSDTWARSFSPFVVGPVDLYDGYTAFNIENAYQYTKLYAEYATVEGEPSQHYWKWAKQGWMNPKPIKYPMGAWAIPLCHWWGGKKLSKLEAQNQIFVSLYKKAILKTSAYQRLKELYETTDKDIYLVDFEGYNHRLLEKSWDQVFSNPDVPIGQAFVLCMLLEGYL